MILWIANLNNKLELIFYKTRLEKSINRILTVFNQQLSQSKYLLGDETWTAADIAALCSLGYYSLRLNEDLLWQYAINDLL